MREGKVAPGEGKLCEPANDILIDAGGRHAKTDAVPETVFKGFAGDGIGALFRAAPCLRDEFAQLGVGLMIGCEQDDALFLGEAKLAANN